MTQDDWSGFAGPVPQVTLFGTPKHGKIVFHNSVGSYAFRLHLPNGAVELSGPDSMLYTSIMSQQYPEYGKGGSNFYWQRPGIGPAPTRTPEQQDYDTVHGHQWRNDRINHGWYWCDDAGDRWRVIVTPLSSTSGTSRTVRIELRLAGAFGEPALIRQQEITVTDPDGGMALHANFPDNDPAAWGMALEDVHPSGQRAAWAITRRAVIGGTTGPLSANYTLYKLTAEAWASLGYDGVGDASFLMPFCPSPIATAFVEIELTGAARSGTWSATPTTILDRAQTYGTFNVSESESVDYVDAWAWWWVRSVEPGPEEGQLKITWSPGSNTTPAGTNPDGFIIGTSTPPTVGIGSGAYTITARDMAVGMFYDEAGSLATVSVDVDYSHAFYADLVVDKSGTRVGYNYSTAPPGTDDRYVIDNKTAGVDVTASYRVKINGVQVLLFPMQFKWALDVETAWSYVGAPDAGSTPTQVSVSATCSKTYKSGDVEYTTPFDPKTLVGIGIVAGGSRQHSGIGKAGYLFSDNLLVPEMEGVIGWALRYGLKYMSGPRPDGPSADNSLGPTEDSRVWNFSLTRASNKLFQYRGAVTSGSVVPGYVTWTLLDPIIGPAGVVAGTPLTSYTTTLPPIHVSYNPFDGTVAREARPVNFV